MGDIGSRQVRFEVLPAAGVPAEPGHVASVDPASVDAASVDVVHTDLRERLAAATGPARP